MNWDTWKENLAVQIPTALIEHLQRHKDRAAERRGPGSDPVLVTIGGEQFAIKPHGGKFAAFLLDHDDCSLEIQTVPGQHNIGVRYSPAGLWEYGLIALQKRIYRAFQLEGVQPRRTDFVRVSYAHFAVDFYSPAFSAEMRPGISAACVIPSRCKSEEDHKVKPIGNALRVETLTLGLSKANLQVQVYDKGREINAPLSGKTWMLELWAKEANFKPADPKKIEHVWRLEIRFGKEYLRERGARSPDRLLDNFAALFGEAIYSRRLTVPNPSDSNRRRWPLHPLWWRARDEAGGGREFTALGRRFSIRRKEMDHLLTGSGAGVVLALSVVRKGDYDPREVRRIADEIPKIIERRRDLEKDVAGLKARYATLDEAR